MGASSSLYESFIKYDIYFSYAEEKELLSTLMEKIKNLDYNILNSSLIKDNLQTYPIAQISSFVQQFFAKTNYIFICISSKSISSICQSIEINEIFKQPSNSCKIIYIMTESNFTPSTNTELYSIIKKNIWLPLYDEESFNQTNEFIISLIEIDKMK